MKGQEQGQAGDAKPELRGNSLWQTWPDLGVVSCDVTIGVGVGRGWEGDHSREGEGCTSHLRRTSHPRGLLLVHPNPRTGPGLGMEAGS